MGQEVLEPAGEKRPGDSKFTGFILDFGGFGASGWIGLAQGETDWFESAEGT